jgi:hypothetical protein
MKVAQRRHARKPVAASGHDGGLADQPLFVTARHVRYSLRARGLALRAHDEDASMSDEKRNFVLFPDAEPEASRSPTLLDRLRSLLASTPFAGLLTSEPEIEPDQSTPTRPRLVFAFDATASREPAWDTARRVTDALVRALPGELDVALAVHGGSRLHTFTEFTVDPRTLRDRAAGITCIPGFTRMLPILSGALKRTGVRIVVYIGDVFEESLGQGRRLADAMAARGIKLIVLHDTSDTSARHHAEIFNDLARRTGGCVLAFDASAPDKLRELLAALAVLAVGGIALLRQKRSELPGALVLLEHLGDSRE